MGPQSLLESRSCYSYGGCSLPVCHHRLRGEIFELRLPYHHPRQPRPSLLLAYPGSLQ